MKLVSNFPKAIADASISPVYVRSNWELEKLEEFIGDLDDTSFSCDWLDRGLVEDCYVSEFTICTSGYGQRSLDEVLSDLRRMATPADLSRC